jgi:competence protein ComEC
VKHADLRLLPAAGALWALAVLGISAGTAALIAAATAGIALALSVVLITRGTALAHTVLAHLGLLVLGCALLVPAVQRAGGSVDLLEDAAAQGMQVELQLALSSEPSVPENGPEWARSGLQTMARTVPGQGTFGRDQHRVPGAVPLLLRAEAEAAEELGRARDGDLVAVRGAVRSSDGLRVLTARSVEVIPRTGVEGMLSNARHQLRVQAREGTSHLPADEAALVRGMSTGDTAGLSATSEEIMRRAGISHLVAVSGANIALVLASVLIPLLLAGVRRRPRLLAAGIAVAGYVWLVGEEPSVQRAATMAAPLLLARFMGLRASAVAALAFTVALWSVLDPVTAASVGFLLSALATAAILIASPVLAQAISELSGERIGPTAALVLAVPLVAQLACTPILILLTPEISIWAVPVNMIVGPLVGPATVIGLIALLLSTVAPAAAEALYTIAAGGTHLVLLIARTADALPGSRIAVPGGTLGVLAAIGVILAVTIWVLARRVAIVHWIMAAALVAVLAPGAARFLPGSPGPAWVVAACAVGQGDAVLVRSDPAATADPSTILIDTGPDPAALTACLDLLGVVTIDLLILSHPHSDHVGGNAALTGSRLPRKQWVCPIEEAAHRVVPGAQVHVATTGHRWEEPGLDIEVLWPPTAADAESAAARESGSGEGDAANDCSLTLSVTWPDGLRLVSLGDLEPAAQQEVAALDVGPTDVVKVAHHGSRFQHEELYQQLDAELGLVTVGSENTFGHPTDELLGILARSGTRPLRTDQHGTVILPAEEPFAPRSVGPAR